MLDQLAPKKVLFGWLEKTHPRCGPKRRWRDIVKKDLLAANINVDTWYDMAHNRGEWYKAYTEEATNYQYTHHHCTEVRKLGVMCVKGRLGEQQIVLVISV